MAVAAPRRVRSGSLSSGESSYSDEEESSGRMKSLVAQVRDENYRRCHTVHIIYAMNVL